VAVAVADDDPLVGLRAAAQIRVEMDLIERQCSFAELATPGVTWTQIAAVLGFPSRRCTRSTVGVAGWAASGPRPRAQARLLRIFLATSSGPPRVRGEHAPPGTAQAAAQDHPRVRAEHAASHWNERRSITAGTSAGARVFWCANEDTATIMIGHDDETWDIALLMPVAVVEKIAALAEDRHLD